MKIYLFFLMTLFLFSNHLSFAQNCEGSDMWPILQDLEGVGELHNCYIEIALSKDDKFVKAQIYARDLYRCHHNILKCQEMALEYRMPLECLNKESGHPGVVKYKKSFKGPNGVKVEKQVTVQFDRFDNLVEMNFSESQFLRSNTDSLVQCRANLFGGGND